MSNKLLAFRDDKPEDNVGDEAWQSAGKEEKQPDNSDDHDIDIEIMR